MQFYCSKKKHKFVSPLLKPGLVELEQQSKLSFEGSPRDKLSSSRYLACSQNENGCHRQDQVRRNLISEIESSLRNEHVGGLQCNSSNKRQGSPSVLDLEDKSMKKRPLSSFRSSDHISKYGELSYNSKEVDHVITTILQLHYTFFE